MKVTRVEKAEFELENGDVFPINPPLKTEMTPDEFQGEIGSGLNDNRAQFKRLLTRVADDDVARVVVEFKDRLTRFGFETFVTYYRNLGVDVVVWSEQLSGRRKASFGLG